MPEIHPTAVLGGDVQLADDVVIGPHCVIQGSVTIGAGTRLAGSAYLTGPLVIGSGNRIYPFVCLGFAPQHRGFDHDEDGLGTVIGNDNIFRESATVHRAYAKDGPTRIGDRNYIMGNSHVGHDVQIGNDCTFTQGSMIGGHAKISDRVLVGGAGAVHQFCRVGTGAMVAGVTALTQDLLPWFTATEVNYAATLNLVGMRRSGMPRDQIDDARWAFKIITQSGRTRQGILDALSERKSSAIVAEYMEWIATCERGYAAGRGRSSHGSARKVES